MLAKFLTPSGQVSPLVKEVVLDSLHVEEEGGLVECSMLEGAPKASGTHPVN